MKGTIGVLDIRGRREKEERKKEKKKEGKS